MEIRAIFWHYKHSLLGRANYLGLERKLNRIVPQIDISKLDFELFHKFRLALFGKSSVYEETPNIAANRNNLEEILHNVSDHPKYAQDVSIIISPTLLAVLPQRPTEAPNPSVSSLKTISWCPISNYFAMNGWKRQKCRCYRFREIASCLYTKANMTRINIITWDQRVWEITHQREQPTRGPVRYFRSF
jgi:hypothetical protein